MEKFANVEVLPSGRFIISLSAFPGYFLKDGNKEIEMDASMDVEIFGKYIARHWISGSVCERRTE